MPVIWEESYLNGLLNAAENEVVNEVDYIFYRFSITVEANKSVYILPAFVRRILRITWQGSKVHPVKAREIAEFDHSSIIVSESLKEEATSSKPLYYSTHPNNFRNIRFYPTPNESIPANDIDLDGSGLDTAVVVTCYRSPNPAFSQFSLPSYISRRTKKAIALSVAFEKEGKGQNLLASAYYRGKAKLSLEYFKKINSGSYVAKWPRLMGQNASMQGSWLDGPVLPSRYPGRYGFR